MSKTTDFILELEAEGFQEYVEDATALAPKPVMATLVRFMRESATVRPALLPERDWFPASDSPFWGRNPLPF